MPGEKITDLPEWIALEDHVHDISSERVSAYFDEDPMRFSSFSVELEGFLFDYSKNRVNVKTRELLCDLARVRGLESKRNAMVEGQKINVTEERSVLHMALRGSLDASLVVDGENVRGFVDTTLERMAFLTQKVRENDEITDVVSIGIGGSDLGPRMVCNALSAYKNGPNVHFVSNIDADEIERVLKTLVPENTLVIIASKTFTTLETLSNARVARDWLLSGVEKDQLGAHLIAVTNAVEKAIEFGLKADRILPMRDWVGGRFSMWGAVGLSIAISCGFEVFERFLEGANAADQHFMNAPLEKNIPVLMGLIGIWYRNFMNYPAYTVLPYAQNLSDFPRYIQQLDMESNGKGVDIDGQVLEVPSGPLVFGEAGTNAQHAYMQLLHQSATVVPVDFIIVRKASHSFDDHHLHLVSNALAQSKALMDGRANTENPWWHFEGNRPSSVLVLETLDAYYLGMLCAFYEHKIFVQGAVWGVNSFDQCGVELGKSIARSLYEKFKSPENCEDLDGSTSGLIVALR